MAPHFSYVQETMIYIALGAAFLAYGVWHPESKIKEDLIKMKRDGDMWFYVTLWLIFWLPALLLALFTKEKK